MAEYSNRYYQEKKEFEDPRNSLVEYKYSSNLILTYNALTI